MFFNKNDRDKMGDLLEKMSQLVFLYNKLSKEIMHLERVLDSINRKFKKKG